VFATKDLFFSKSGQVSQILPLLPNLPRNGEQKQAHSFTGFGCLRYASNRFHVGGKKMKGAQRR